MYILRDIENGKPRRVTLPTYVVKFPWFAFGHITLFVHLSNKLASHGVQISFLSAPGNIHRISLSLNSSPLIKIIHVHIPAVDGLPPGLDSTADMSPALADLLKIALDKMQPQIRSILINLKPHIVFIDFAQHWLPSIASSPGIKTFNFSIFAAACGAYVTNTYRESLTIDDLKKPPPGFPITSISSASTYQARDFLYPFKSSDGDPSVNERVQTVRKLSDAIVMKSCDELKVLT